MVRPKQEMGGENHQRPVQGILRVNVRRSVNAETGWNESYGLNDMRTQSMEPGNTRGRRLFLLPLLLLTWSVAWSQQDPLQDRSFTRLPGYKNTNVTPKP